MSEDKQGKSKGHRWKPGQSGNPAGRPADQLYKEALAMLRAKSPELMEKAIDMALDGNPKVVCAILSKICPDKLDLGGELSESLAAVAKAIVEKRGRKPE